MDKQKHQNLVKKYFAFFTFCVGLLIIGIIFSVPIKVEVHSVGEKPPFLFAVLSSISLLALSSGFAYLSYLYWFQPTKARTKLTASIERSAKRFFIFRLPIYNLTFLFWYFRVIAPVTTLVLFGFFLLVVFSAF